MHTTYLAGIPSDEKHKHQVECDVDTRQKNQSNLVEEETQVTWRRRFSLAQGGDGGVAVGQNRLHAFRRGVLHAKQGNLLGGVC